MITVLKIWVFPLIPTTQKINLQTKRKKMSMKHMEEEQKEEGNPSPSLNPELVS